MNRKTDLNYSEISSCIETLSTKLQDCWSDWRILFSDRQIMDTVLELATLMQTIGLDEETDDDVDELDDTRSPAENLLQLNKCCSDFQHLYTIFDTLLGKLEMCHDVTFENPFFSTEVIDELSSASYMQELGGDVRQHLSELNVEIRQELTHTRTILKSVSDIILSVMKQGKEIADARCPSRDKIVEAIENDIRMTTSYVADDWLDDMKQHLCMYYNTKPTELSDPNQWCVMQSEINEALTLAMEQGFADNEDQKYELWREDLRDEMDENPELVRRIFCMFYPDKLFDLRPISDLGDPICLLDETNLYMFYEIIVKWNLVQCEMFPELKKQHEEWLNKGVEVSDTLICEAIVAALSVSGAASAKWVGIYFAWKKDPRLPEDFKDYKEFMGLMNGPGFKDARTEKLKGKKVAETGLKDYWNIDYLNDNEISQWEQNGWQKNGAETKKTSWEGVEVAKRAGLKFKKTIDSGLSSID